MLEALDELGWPPCCISGTSIRAIIGALCAAGISASRLRENLTAASFNSNGSIIDDIFNKKLRRWWDLLDLDFSGKNLLYIKAFLANLDENVKRSAFEELKTPPRIVAADFWKREQMDFDQVPLVPAVHASAQDDLPEKYGRILTSSSGENEDLARKSACASRHVLPIIMG
jgi:NTE family protein